MLIDKSRMFELWRKYQRDDFLLDAEFEELINELPANRRNIDRCSEKLQESLDELEKLLGNF